MGFQGYDFKGVFLSLSFYVWAFMAGLSWLCFYGGAFMPVLLCLGFYG